MHKSIKTLALFHHKFHIFRIKKWYYFATLLISEIHNCSKLFQLFIAPISILLYEVLFIEISVYHCIIKLFLILFFFEIQLIKNKSEGIQQVAHIPFYFY